MKRAYSSLLPQSSSLSSSLLNLQRCYHNHLHRLLLLLCVIDLYFIFFTSKDLIFTNRFPKLFDDGRRCKVAKWRLGNWSKCLVC
ncbi:hypothetical protein QVD17_41575 [Tagetes erecta]|uniref:Uncharacterized protein n=1 Tax=Tagetes erecta TaxID=13708 RepID=A0AAD8JKQ1_TARER|nr:hypothetical protein QVD17_41575 [Tagetes erecta]